MATEPKKSLQALAEMSWLEGGKGPATADWQAVYTPPEDTLSGDAFITLFDGKTMGQVIVLPPGVVLARAGAQSAIMLPEGEIESLLEAVQQNCEEGDRLWYAAHKVSAWLTWMTQQER